MRKLRILLFALLGVIGLQGMAQSRGAMFLGATMPLKEYAKFDGFDNFALFNAGNNAGAAVGFNLGLKWYYNVGVEGLGVMLSLDGFYNGPNADLKLAYREQQGQLGNPILSHSFIYNATSSFINVPAMLGVNYIYRFSPQFAIFAEAGAGANLRFITGLESVRDDAVLSIETRTRTFIKYDNVFSFAYQAGFGIEIAKVFMLSFGFYDLGNGIVKGEEELRVTTLNDNITNTTWNYKTYGNVHPIMLVGRIGFSF